MTETGHEMVHVPLLRFGRPYKSLDVVRVVHHRTGEPVAEVSQANPGLIRHDLQRQHDAREALARVPARRLVDICARAADHFLHDALPLDPDGPPQTPADYTQQLSATTGLPHVMVRRNMAKIHGVFAEMGEVLNGLTRGLDLRIFDEGAGEIEGRLLSFFPRASSLGVVLPNNSPGVHTLWAPAVAMKIPLFIKPGSAELWTPFRMAQALIRAGCPPEAFCYFPSGHAGAGEILRLAGRGMVFGDASTTKLWQGDARIERHGPGFSKVVIGADCLDQWPRYLDVVVQSILENGGRSCVNASGVWVPGRADEIAEAIAARLSAVVPRPADDPEAEIAPFSDPGVARRISEQIDRGLAEPGARDVTAAHRSSGRLVTSGGCTYLLPTVVRCQSADHTLANKEYLFPFASVLEVPQAEMPEVFGPTLVVTAITHDPAFIRRLVQSPGVDRLNVGAIPTNRLTWDQPHEGNLFEHLYARRAYQVAV